MTTPFNDLLSEGGAPPVPQIAPFFFLNHNLEEQRLSWHVDQMQEAGFDGFFMHAREGLQTPYLSQDWFDAIEVCVQRAAELGMKAWLYDEMPYPSGAAGGGVVRRRPDFIEQSLGIRISRVEGGRTFDWELGEREVLAVFARCKSNPRLKTLDLTSCVGPVADTWIKTDWDSRWYYPEGLTERFKCPRTICVLPKNHLRVELPSGLWEIAVVELKRGGEELEPFGHYVDVSNPHATELFIALTHERYRARFAAHFGTTIPGIFFDEPKFRSALPWGSGVAKAVGGLSANLVFALTGKTGTAAETERRNYRRHLDHSFHTGWLDPIKNWCAANGLALTGHISPEEDWWFESRQTGSILKKLRQLDVPGCDLIIPATGNWRNPVLNLTAGLAVSAAAQSGRKYALCELFAASGLYLGFPTMHSIAAWLACHGINFLVPHGWFYSMDGYRKFDAPPSFAPPGYDPAELKQWSDTFRSIARGPAKNADLLIIRPIDYLRGLPDSSKPKADRLLADAALLSTQLLYKGITHHWMDDDELSEIKIVKKKIIFKECQYTNLVYFEGFISKAIIRIISDLRSVIPVMSARTARRGIFPRIFSNGEIAGRALDNEWLLVNLGTESASAKIGQSTIQLLPGEIFFGDPDGQFPGHSKKGQKTQFQTRAPWRLEWPQSCAYTPGPWRTNEEKTIFGPHFQMESSTPGVRGRTVFGEVPLCDDLKASHQLIYETIFHCEKISNLHLEFEKGNMRGKWSASLNDHRLLHWKETDDFHLTHAISTFTQPEKNTLRIIFEILRPMDGMLAPCRITGCFALNSAGKLIPSPETFLTVPLNRGYKLPYIEGPLRWHSGFDLTDRNASGAWLHFKKAPKDTTHFLINNRRTHSLQNAPWVIEITTFLKPGWNEIICVQTPNGQQKMARPPSLALLLGD